MIAKKSTCFLQLPQNVLILLIVPFSFPSVNLNFAMYSYSYLYDLFTASNTMASFHGMIKLVLMVTLCLVLGIKEDNAVVTGTPPPPLSSLNPQANSTAIPAPSALEEASSSCPINSQEIRVCDTIRDGVNIAASLLGGLPSLKGPKGEPGAVGLKGRPKNLQNEIRKGGR